MTKGPFPGGSVWRKWDLHIHSPLSLLNNQFPHEPTGSPDWEAYISTLEALDVCVVGITDYFTIESYKKLREFKAQGHLKNLTTILPNIEFRLKSIVSTRRQRETRLNLHVIFSDEVSVRDIEEHFLHDITFYYQGDPQNPDQKRKLKTSNLEALGAELLKQHEQFRNMNLQASVLGAMQAVVDHEEITRILTGDSRFKGRYLVVLPATGWDEISWDGQAHLARKSLLQKSDMVLSGSPSTRSWCQGNPPYQEGPEKFKEEFSTIKPCLHGSDAHKLGEIGNPCGRRGNPDHDCEQDREQCEPKYCWIKADPTFEGLKQLLYEPCDRVAIQPLDPTPLKSNSCIKGCRFDGTKVNDVLSLAPTNLSFNSGLVAVTGGKGAGKTALVDLIANFFVDRCNVDDPNSFVRRIAKDDPNFRAAITLGDGSLFDKSLVEPQFVEQSDVVYIAQGELENYIGEKSDLDKYIRDLIFESPDVKNTVRIFEFEKLTKRISEIESETSQKHRQVALLESRTAEPMLAAARRERVQFQAELRDVDSKLPALAAHLTKEKLDVVTQKQANRSTLLDRKSRLIEVGESLANVKQFLSEDLSRFNRYTARIGVLLRELDIDGDLPSLDYSAMVRLDGIAKEVEQQLNQIVASIEASEKELRGYEAEMQEHARYLSRKNEISARLADIEKKLEAIANDRNQLDSERHTRDGLFSTLLHTVLEQQHKYAEIIDVFGSQKAEVLSDLDFSANIQFSHSTLLATLQELLDNRQVEVLGTDDVPSQFQTLQDLYGRVSAGEATQIDQLVIETSKLCEEMKGKMKKSQAISASNLYRCLYGTYLNVVPVVTYKKTAISRLSLGQKATVLIKIYLAQGNNPIIIDSHDDHLDNEFIMDELVGAIRKAKTYRQVILASNNGNVVINSDAEQVIIANRQQGRISYNSGSIENPSIRDRALTVLEGGLDAFKKRQEKYRIEK